jgi:F-type H+-transporting ATPase subunit b
MKLKYILALLLPAVLFGGGDGPVSITDTDIVPRLINFIIFVSILYYLLAKHIKKAYKNRIAGIADRLDSIQTKVKESVKAKRSAQSKVEEAKVNAHSLVETSKKEAQLIANKIVSDTDFELQNLEKSYKEKIDVERRRVARDTVSSILDSMFDKDSISIDRDELVKIVLKRVA